MIRGSGSGKKYALRNLVSHQPDANKTYLYALSIKPKYKFLINNWKI